MSRNDEQPVRELLAGYKKLNFFKRLFFPSGLALALEAFEMAVGETNQRATTNDVYHAFAIHTGLITRWLFSCLSLFEKETAQLSSQTIIPLIDEPVEEIEPSDILSDIPLDQKAIFDGFPSFFIGEHAAENKDAISECADLKSLLLTLQVIESAGLLDGEHAQAHFQAIVRSHESTLSFLRTYALEQDNLLKGSEGHDYFQIILNFFEDPNASGFPSKKIASAQRLLQDFKLLTPSRFQNAIWAAELDAKREILERLRDEQLLTENDPPDYFGKVLQVHSPADFKSAMDVLKKIDSLTKENIESLLNASPTWYAALSPILLPLDKTKLRILCPSWRVFFPLLDKAGLLKDDPIIVENRQPSSQMLTLKDFVPALSRLSKAKLLDKSDSDVYVEMLLLANAPDEFADGLILFAEAMLIDHWRVCDYFLNMTTSTKPKHIAETILILDQMDLLNNENMLRFFESLISFDKLDDYLPALKIVHELGLLTNQDGRANFARLIQLIKDKGCTSIVSTLELLQKVGLFKKVPKYWHNNSVFAEQLTFHPSFINIFKMLDERKVFNGENAIDYFWLITKLKEEQNLQELESSLTLLNSGNLLQGEHVWREVKAVVTLISKSQAPSVVLSNLKALHDKNALTHEDLNAMVLARSPAEVVSGILILHEAGLAQQCREQIIRSDTPKEWASGLVILKNADLLGTPFQKAIYSISPLEQGVIFLEALYSTGLLTNANKDENISKINEIIESVEFHWGDNLAPLSRLLQKPLFTGVHSQTNFDAIFDAASKERALSSDSAYPNFLFGSSYLHDLASCLEHLDKCGLLAESDGQKNFEALMKRSHYELGDSLEPIFSLLEELLSKSKQKQRYFDLILEEEARDMSSLPSSLKNAAEANLLNGEDAEKNLELILLKGMPKKEKSTKVIWTRGTKMFCPAKRSYGTVEGMIILNQIGLLNDTTRKTIALTKLPHSFATAISVLHTTNLFKGDNASSNLNLLANNASSQLVSLLSVLFEARIFEEETQTRFSAVMKYVKSLVISWSHVFYDVPAHLLTVNLFNRVIELARTHPNDAYSVITSTLREMLIQTVEQSHLNTVPMVSPR